MLKKKAVLYPVDIEICPVIRHKALLKEYEIVGLVSPKGWGYGDKDLSYIDGGCDTGMVLGDDFSKVLDQCDTVIFCDSQYYNGMESDIINKMKEAINNNKNIVSLIQLENKYFDEIIELSSQKRCQFSFMNNELKEIDINSNYNFRNKLKISGMEYKSKSNAYESIGKIKTPVIFVMGVTERSSKFEIQLTIKEQLEKLGYRITHIGSRNYCEMIGGHSFPSFLYDNTISEVDKILMYHDYVKAIEEAEAPDIIIIGIPGGITKVNDKFTNKFGIYAYEISQAIDPDYVIMSVFYEDFKAEYLDNLSILSKYRFGFEVDSFNLANIQMDWESVLRLSGDNYIKLESDFINQKIKKYENDNKMIFNIFNKDHGISMADDIINRLSNYSDIEIL